MDLGYCDKHNRQLEALCKDCEEPVCASCVLFDLHLKHDIIPFEEGAGYLKQSITYNKKRGVLNVDFSEAHLLEIREYGLRLDKYKSDTIKKIEDCFNAIIRALKQRKTDILSVINNKFTTEKEKVQKEEDSWRDKEEMGERILSMTKSPNDANILLNAKYIMDSLRILNTDMVFRSAKIFNVLDTNLQLTEDITLSYEEMIYYFSRYLTILEPNILEFKA